MPIIPNPMETIKNPATKLELVSRGAEFRPFGCNDDSVAILYKKKRQILFLKRSNMYYLIA